ncbi:SRPBCC domain-containing protein [Catenulispora sp. NF23]|nr:SRPBCC domain-containing protein [Catenulispora pinistramenti]
MPRPRPDQEAGLVVTRRRGREKLHYLNPVPIRLVHDRWVGKYTEQWAAGLVGLQHELEQEQERQLMERVFEIYIRTTPERLWEAITDPAIRAKYHFGASVESDWTEGSAYRLARAVGSGGRGGRDVTGDVGDRAGRGRVPADRRARPTAAGRAVRGLRRLADGVVRAEDVAGDRGDAHHTRFAYVSEH